MPQFSKIGKVMRHITALPPEKLPRDNDFNFKQRAVALVDRWHQILSANKSNGNADDNPATAAAKEDADKEDGVKEDGAKEDGTKEDGAKEEALSPKVNGASGDATTAGQTDATAEPAVAVQSDEQMRQA